MIVLGLDISTSITAYTIINTELSPGERLLKSEGIYLSDIKDSYRKACKVRDTFLELSNDYNIQKIAIEESLQSFRSGLSSAKTLSSLTRFNGIVSFFAEDIFGGKIERINVNSARKNLSIKVDRKSPIHTKEQVRDWVMNHKEFKNFTWPTKTLKSGPRKGQVIFHESCLDIADSAVMALCVL